VQWLIGIDEAGRGALAGPVCVGAVLFPDDLDWKEAFSLVTRRGKPKLRDSKQLTAQQRDILFDYITAHGRLRHAAAFVDAKTIDEIGIVNAANEAATLALSSLDISPSRVSILLDAGLRVPAKWSQESFIRGDERIPAISFASIIAKVTRDRLMEELSTSHSKYHFEQHKGYGTLAHRRAIRSSGLSDIHRASFCTRLLHGSASVRVA
jgi:ribonuclease HII